MNRKNRLIIGQAGFIEHSHSRIGDVDVKGFIYIAIPIDFFWVTLLNAELAEPEEMRKEFDLHVLAVEDDSLNDRSIDYSLFDFLFSQMFVFLPKFIKTQL